jgi:phosphoribosylformimino-5-aminoimidazole carboxamide ribonucleotide (ProFAR) isomerase
MSLLTEITEKYKENLKTISGKDEEKVLKAINLAIERCETNCCVGKLEQTTRVSEWLRKEGFSVTVTSDFRDGNYIHISGWDK